MLLLGPSLVCVLLGARAAVGIVQGDFLTRYAAAHVVAAGGDPYDQAQLREVQVQVAGPEASRYPAYDPPPVFALFRLVAELPLRAAQLVWWLLSCVALALLGLVAARVAGAVVGRDVPRAVTAALVVLVPTLGPAKHALVLGQLDPLFVVPLLTGVLLLHRSRSEWAVGALAPLSLLKPQTALLPVLVAGVAAIGRRRAAAAAVVAAVLLLAVLSATAAPSASWAGWLSAVRSNTGSAAALLVAVRGCLAVVGAALLATCVPALRALPAQRRLAMSVSLACAAEGLLAGLVRWNPQWSLLAALPLAVVLLCVRSSTWRPGPLARAALVVVAGILVTDGLNSTMYDARSVSHAVLPILLAASVMAGLVVAGELGAPSAAAVVAVNAAITLPPLSPEVHALLALLAAVLLVGVLRRVLVDGEWHASSARQAHATA